MTSRRCWGIARETAHSPGRESDDAEILRLTGKHLESWGFSVELKNPEELFEPVEELPTSIFLMCERADALRLLSDWTERGVQQINSPAAVLNTYRERLIAKLGQAGLPFIPSQLVRTTGEVDCPPPPRWIKRADVHNTQEGDVVFADTPQATARALAGLASRGMAQAIVQPHLEGDLIKFYGIGAGGGAAGRPSWFRWFYHKDQRLRRYSFAQKALRRLVQQAASALSLEVYGGDVIVAPDGRLVLLDINAWPSFALYREAAAAAIGAHLARRFGGPAR